MKRIHPGADWPESWRLSYAYDLLEVYGDRSNLGYTYAYEQRRDRALELVASVLAPGGSILDIAAAQGNFSLALAERGYAVTWNDIRADLVDYVKMKYERGTIAYAPGNAFDLSFPRLFDAVLVTEIIEHVAHPDAFLAHVAKLVRPGGHIVMTTPNGKYFRNRLPRFSDCPDPSAFEALQFKPNADGHIFLLHPDEIPPLAAAANLSLAATSTFTTPLTAGHLKSRALLPKVPKAFVATAERLACRLPAPFAERLMVQQSAIFDVPPLRDATGGA